MCNNETNFLITWSFYALLKMERKKEKEEEKKHEK